MTLKLRLPWRRTSLDQRIAEAEQRLALRKLSTTAKAQALEQRLRSTLGSPIALLLAAGTGVLLARIRIPSGAAGGIVGCATGGPAAPAGPSVTSDLVRALILAFVR